MNKGTLFDEIKSRLLCAAKDSNCYAISKDVTRNYAQHGMAIAYADVLRELGHTVAMPVRMESGYCNCMS